MDTYKKKIIQIIIQISSKMMEIIKINPLVKNTKLIPKSNSLSKNKLLLKIN